MKMVKKILLGMSAAAVIMSLVGCGDLAGVGRGSGTKEDKTITVDGTASNLSTKYRRYIKQLGSSEKVAEITTTITVDTSKCTLQSTDSAGNPTYANVGFVFDMNKSWNTETNSATTDSTNSKLRDLVVFGFQPLNKRAYVEHYSNVNFKDELDTDDSAVGVRDRAIFGGGSWGAVTENTDYTLANGVYTLVVSVKQTQKGIYDFYLGNRKLGSYHAAGHFMGTTADGAKDFAIGGVGAYVNCPKGTKVVAKYETEKSSVTGKFEAEEIEE